MSSRFGRAHLSKVPCDGQSKREQLVRSAVDIPGGESSVGVLGWLRRPGAVWGCGRVKVSLLSGTGEGTRAVSSAGTTYSMAT